MSIRSSATNRIRSVSIALVMFAGLIAAASVRPVSAYAPNVSGRVFIDTGAPVSGIWVQWESNEEGNDGNEANRGTHYRYSGTSAEGKFFFKGWDLEGVRSAGGQTYSNYGQKEFDERIDLDYDPANGKEARRASSNQYNIFNCNNEANIFSLRLPSSMSGARVEGRWRRDNSTDWSAWTSNRVSMPKDIFNNSHDYEMEFRIKLPKQSSTQVLDKDLEPSSIQGLRSLVPACVKTDLCAAEGNCSSAQRQSAGVRRVLLSALGGTSIGDAQRKLAIGDGSNPIWLTECVQTGTAAEPSYICTTGNSQLDLKIFKSDNLATLRNRYGYSAKVYFTDGTTQTTAEITAANRRDAYEWETTINPDRVQPGQLTSVFMAMYDPATSNPVSSGDRPTQLQATLSNAEECRLVIDPYGRVFDTFTLEPLAGVTVLLTKQRAAGSYTPVAQSDVVGVIRNPQITARDGLFSFHVPPGTYRLSPSREGYRFPAANISPLAKQMYANLYTGQDIKVVDKIVHTDIPLEPLDTGAAVAYAKNNPIKIQSYFQVVDPRLGTYRIEGAVSHPLATVNLYTGDENKKLLHTTTADTFGYFKIVLKLSAIGGDVRITQLEAKKKEVPAFQSSGDEFVVRLEPVLQDLDGFAVDRSGRLIANAAVSVYAGESSTPVYTTIADNDGRFVVPRAVLPPISYKLGFDSGTVRDTVSVSEFIARNAALSHPRNVYVARGSSLETVLGERSPSRRGARETGGFGGEGLGSSAPRSPLSMAAAAAMALVAMVLTAILISYFRHETQVRRKRR